MLIEVILVAWVLLDRAGLLEKVGFTFASIFIRIFQRYILLCLSATINAIIFLLGLLVPSAKLKTVDLTTSVPLCDDIC